MQCILAFFSFPSSLYLHKTCLYVLLFLGNKIANEEADGNANEEKLNRISKMMEIEDLRGSNDLPLAPLSIKVWFSHYHVLAGDCISSYILCYICETRIHGTILILNKLVHLKLQEMHLLELKH